MDCVRKKLIPQFHKKFFVFQNAQHAMQKNPSELRLDNKKRMSIASYINIYNYVKCDKNDSKPKCSNNLNTAV